ncbi:MAG TPA: gluconate 2-dehydrogenase subunit 3 family protein, partial [Gemmatimonadaceae bacterium]|nr:gluconate 2-dehydrogenase subunit 3 family protein [Gemmatimonadaceae bacterium]
MSDSENTREDTPEMITRREAVLRVSALLGGAALIGGNALLTGCRDDSGEKTAGSFAPFTADEIAFLDEVADTILPTTSTPGAKAAQTGALMALIVTDSYSPADQKAFRDGMATLDERSREMNKAAFMESTAQQRLALLEVLDREQKADADKRDEEKKKKEAEKFLSDQRQEAAPDAPDASPAPGITADPPRHYFRMMKELALLGYFTSEIGATQAL